MDEEALRKPQAGSSTKLSLSRRDPLSWRMERVRLLCACYRKDEATDPEIYATAMAAVLSEYPDDIVEYITDPRTGLPIKCKTLPTVKDVHDACIGIIRSRQIAEERMSRTAEQLRQREEGRREPYNPRVAQGLRDLADDLRLKQRKEPTQQGALDKLRVEFGAVVDEIPNAPEATWKRFGRV